jgi:hypothetical protein
MKRRLSRGLLAIFVVSVTFLYPLLAPLPHRIDEQHFKLIQNGMSCAEVENILGAPPGEYDWMEFDGEAFQKRKLEWIFTLASSESNLDLTVGSRVIRKIYSSNGGVIGVVTIVPDKSKVKQWTARFGSIEIEFSNNDKVLVGTFRRDVRLVTPWNRWWTNSTSH